MAVGPAEGAADVLGRVTAASIARVSAECYQLDGAPPLGALVVVEDSRGDLFAVVCDAQTTSIEPGRRPLAHAPPDADADAVFADNPHLRLLLHTTFDALVVGHETGGAIRQGLPPGPARIYARVWPCPAPQMGRFAEELPFLNLLLASGPAADEVTTACLRHLATVQADERGFLVRAGKGLLALLGREPDRLANLLRGLQS